jgi:hypothetical protein
MADALVQDIDLMLLRTAGQHIHRHHILEATPDEVIMKVICWYQEAGWDIQHQGDCLVLTDPNQA